MFLTRTTFNNIKRLFANSLDDAGRAAFSKLPPDEQMLKLRSICPAEKAAQDELAGFILVLHIRSKLVAAGSEAHYALRESLGLSPVRPWHKPRPPKTSWEMQDANRVPSWLDECQVMGAITRTITWDDVRAGPELIAAAVRVFFKFGGMEDLGDPRAIQHTDPTMKLFLEGISYSLITTRPEWHDTEGVPLKDIPSGVDGRSQDEIDQEHERAVKLKRTEEARESTRLRREKELNEYGALRSNVLGMFRCDATSVMAHELSISEFEDTKTTHEATILGGLGSVTKQIFDLLSSTTTLAEGAGAEEVAELRNEVLERAKALTIQLVLEDVNEHQSGWFRRLSNGDFRFRPQPLKGDARAPGYVSKKEKAASRAISKIYIDYGEDVLNFALKTIVGQVLAGKAQIVKAPDWLKFKGGDEEIVVTGVPGDDADTDTQLPPPPPAPPAPPVGGLTL